MKVKESMIPLIEKALGFKLYEWQRNYILEESYSEPTERRSGRTTAYIVRLLLTNREPINIKFDAMKYKDHRSVHYTDIFRNFMKDIDEKLTSVGLNTCSVKPKRNQSISIELDFDSDKLQLKLKAIAKHAESLADELYRIDNALKCPECEGISLYETTENLFITNFHMSETKWHECSECGYSDKDNEAQC